jgi:4-hydroxy-2-oxoheptanedioate aldolase
VRTNNLKPRLAAGETCRGIWLALPSVETARLVARLPADWIVVDAEHAPLDVPGLTGIVAAILEAGGPAPLVRVADAAVEPIKRALDAGAWGVIAPMVSTRAEAERVVSAARYPPEGSRSFGSFWAPLGFDTDAPGYLQVVNRETLVGVQIETVTALKNLEAILSTPGIDLCFVGPFDLSLSLGVDPFAPEPPQMLEEALDYFVRVARRHHVPTGIFCPNGRVAAARIAQGFQFVNAGTDVGALTRGLAAELGAISGN